MNTRQLKTFVAVVTAGSFAKAAEQEYLSSSALIQQIQTLEKEVGCALLHRSPSGVSLTAAGQIFFDTALSLTSQLEQTIARCRQLAGEDERTLSIGFFKNNLPCYTPLAVCKFSSRHPQYKINLTSTSLDQALSDVRDGKLDICEYAFSEEITRMNLAFTELYASPRYCLVSAGNPLSQKSVLTKADLLHHKVAIHSFQWSPELVAWCQAEPAVDLMQIPCSTDTVYSVCIEGGVYLLPEQSLQQYPMLRGVPLSPSFTTKYGYVHRRNCKKLIKLFLDAVSA